MNEHEARIDRVLRALGGPDAPEGMAERVVRHTASATAHHEKTAATAWVLVAFTAAVCVLLAIARVIHLQHREAPVIAVKAQPAAKQPQAIAGPPTHIAVTQSRMGHGMGKHHIQGRGKQTSADVQSAMVLVNRPAPEEPLTEQERLIIQLTRRTSPRTLLALVRVHAGDTSDPKEWGDFDEFFAPQFRTVEQIQALQPRWIETPR